MAGPRNALTLTEVKRSKLGLGLGWVEGEDLPVDTTARFSSYFVPGRIAKYCDEHVCSSVCPLA